MFTQRTIVPEHALVPFVAFGLFPGHAGLIHLSWLRRWRSSFVEVLALVSPIALSTLEVVADLLLAWARGSRACGCSRSTSTFPRAWSSSATTRVGASGNVGRWSSKLVAVGSSNLLPVLVSSLTIEQISKGLDQPVVRAFFRAVFCSLVLFEIMLHLSGLPHFSGLPKFTKEMSLSVISSGKWLIPAITASLIVDEGSQVVS